MLAQGGIDALRQCRKADSLGWHKHPAGSGQIEVEIVGHPGWTRRDAPVDAHVADHFKVCQVFVGQLRVGENFGQQDTKRPDV